MYIPKTFEVTDSSTLHEFIDTYSFGTLVTVGGEQAIATRIPLILDRASGRHGTLLGHVARANPQWRSFDGNRQCLVMFDGPHAYVSPSWYATSPAVPTWNYATVHVYGTPRPIHDMEQLSALVDRLVGIYEAGMPQPWPGKLPDRLQGGDAQGHRRVRGRDRSNRRQVQTGTESAVGRPNRHSRAARKQFRSGGSRTGGTHSQAPGSRRDGRGAAGARRTRSNDAPPCRTRFT